jgi:protein-S-isoprenylcysteine O-methyltransferase Ste14
MRRSPILETYQIADSPFIKELLCLLIISTRLEEKKLVLEFGDTYVKYQQEVPMFIPFIK